MNFKYDERGDVLYVGLKGHPTPDCKYIEVDEGNVVRVSPDGEAVGLTLTFFKARFVSPALQAQTQQASAENNQSNSRKQEGKR